MIKLKDIVKDILTEGPKAHNRCLNKCHRKHDLGSEGHNDCVDGCDGIMYKPTGGFGDIGGSLLSRQQKRNRRRLVRRGRYRG